MITGLLNRLATLRSCQSVARTAVRSSTREGFAPGSPSTTKHALACDDTHGSLDRREAPVLADRAATTGKGGGLTRRAGGAQKGRAGGFPEAYVPGYRYWHGAAVAETPRPPSCGFGRLGGLTCWENLGQLKRVAIMARDVSPRVRSGDCRGAGLCWRP
jgi:hypothetical protein